MLNIKYILFIGLIINVIASLNASLFSHSQPEVVNSNDIDDQECIKLKKNNNDDKPGHSFNYHHQTLVANLNDSIQDELKHTFKGRVDCLVNAFGDNLNEMNKLYTSNDESSNINDNKISKNNKKDKKNNRKNKKEKTLKLNFYGQIGYIFYSIDQNNTINFIQHESFKFLKANQSNDEQTSLNQTELEQELEKYSNDMQILKQLLNNLKEQSKEVTKKLKQTKVLSSSSTQTSVVEEKKHEKIIQDHEEDKVNNDEDENIDKESVKSEKETKKTKSNDSNHGKKSKKSTKNDNNSNVRRKKSTK